MSTENKENKEIEPPVGIVDTEVKRKGTVDHRKFLFETFHLAHETVKLDMLDFYKDETFKMYEELSQRFDLLAPYLPEEYKGVTNKFAKTYLFRSEELSKNSENVSLSVPLMEKYKEWRKEEMPECGLDFEKEKSMRAIWFMKNIKLSISSKFGGYLLPDFFIPKLVWEQRGYQLRFLKEKVDLFRRLSGEFKSRSRQGMNVQKLRQSALVDLKSGLLKHLDFFTKLTDGKNEKMMKKSIQNQEKMMKKLQKKTTKGKKLDGGDFEPLYNEEYVKELMCFIDSVMFLERWIEDALKNNDTVQVSALEDIGYNLYFSVLVKIVFKDITSLIKCYFRRCKQVMIT